LKTGSSKDWLRFAIVGCGRIAVRHAAHIANKAKLIAVCDIDAEKALALGNLYNAKVYYDIDEMLTAEKSVQAVAVCTPNGLHKEHTVKALNAGFHVICEKPMATSPSACKEMIEAAGKNDRKLFVIKQNRFNPPVEALKKLLDEGRLGKIFSFQLNCFWNREADYYHNSWRGSINLDGGTLYTQFSHFIDLLYWMFGDIEDVKAFTGNFKHQDIIEFEDTGAVILKFKNGLIGTINYTVNSHKKNMEGSLLLFGEKGTVKIGGQYLNELEYQSIEDYAIENLPAGNRANDYGNYVGSMSNHDKVYGNVIDVLQHNAKMATSAFEGLKTVEIIDKIYQSANK
jgi:UDP-N-acetyl-2-amino-2-deoxyglucuronate dehydrogenase